MLTVWLEDRGTVVTGHYGTISAVKDVIVGLIKYWSVRYEIDRAQLNGWIFREEKLSQVSQFLGVGFGQK